MEYMAFLVLISSLLAIVWVIFEVPLKQFFAGLIKADTKVFPVECVFGRLELIPDCDAAAPRMFIVHRVRMTNKTSEPAHLSAVLALRFNMEISKGEGEAHFRATDTGRDEYERVLQSNAQYRFIPMPLHLEAKRTVSGELAFLMPEWRAPMWAPNPDLKPNVVRRRTDELRSIDAALEITDFLSGSRVVVELPGKHVP